MLSYKINGLKGRKRKMIDYINLKEWGKTRKRNSEKNKRTVRRKEQFKRAKRLWLPRPIGCRC